MLHIKRTIQALHTTLYPHIANADVASKLIEYYDGDAGQRTNWKNGDLGFGYLHYALIRIQKPKHILVIGSRKGYIPAILSLACQDNKMGHVDFVDAGYGKDNPKHWTGIAWWKKINPRKHFLFFKVNAALTTYVMTTKEFAAKYPKTVYEYIYIDGDHSYEGVSLDYRLFWPRLAKGGFMVFHDAYVKHTTLLGDFGVWKLWKRINSKNKILFPFPKESGLGIIQK